MRKALFGGLLAVFATTSLFAQAPPRTGVEITKIDTMFEKTPVYNIGVGPRRNVGASRDWFVIEVEFGYQRMGPNDPPFLDELTFNYYVALNNRGPQNPQPTLLTGTIIHVAMPESKGMRSVAFVSPRTLERFFEGRAPTNANQVTMAVGVTITRAGQVVAEKSTGEGANRPQWWTQLQQGPPGLVLNKNETPFAPLFGDYYEAIRAKTP